MIVNRKISVTALWLCCVISVSAQGIDSIGWRQVFTEPQLVSLIETALEQNADLRTANLNVVQAEAQLKAARLAFLPSLTVGAEGQLSKTKGQPTQKTYNIPVSMQWEVDLAGRLRGEKRAAVATYWSTAETERAVRLQLIATVATHYYTLAMMDEQLAVTRENISNAKQTVEVMQTLKEVGIQNEAAVSAARATWLNVAAQEKTLLKQIQTTENAIRVLVGKQLESIGRTGFGNAGVSMKYQVGTMIEIPRAALTADEIAKEAEFFSFGTNDLTQMTFGFSRDDAGKFLGSYYQNKIYEQDPFAKVDQKGVGKLIKMAAELGRSERKNLKLGVCGEHGGDPASVEFFNSVGLTYVSCSPFRVPIARLAAAQAAIKAKEAQKEAKKSKK